MSSKTAATREVVVQNHGISAVRGSTGLTRKLVVMISNAKANFQRISPRKARMTSII